MLKRMTRKKLLELIKSEGEIYNYHMYVNQWTTYQANLRQETFDGKTEIVIATDYAAAYEMTQRVTEKCSHGTSCSQLGALVLHSPGERPPMAEDEPAQSSSLGPRPVICDVWRMWSQKKGNASWHQDAMKEIALYYKQDEVPALKTVHVITDGQRSQYKGRKNLGAMAEWPYKALPT